jgi:hypothetical protein
MLFAEWGSTANVVPVLDHGETEDHWVILMPLAEMSLRGWLSERTTRERRPDPLRPLKIAAASLLGFIVTFGAPATTACLNR